jgi:hypothetical protein
MIRQCRLCERAVYGRGLCNAHYTAARRRNPYRPLCEVRGCALPVHARGLCTTCYQRWRRRTIAPVCRATGCQGPRDTGGLCNNHHKAVQRGHVAICATGCVVPQLAGRGLCSRCYMRAWRAEKREHDYAA